MSSNATADTATCDGSDSSAEDAFFHASNVFLALAFAFPNTSYGQVVMHSLLIVGYLIHSTWAWNVICAPDIFTWYFGHMLLNCGQLLYVLYQLRPIYFDPALDDVYEQLFRPLQITRLQFRRLVVGVGGGDGPQIVRLHAGECYAVENMTKTDRLALLVSGRLHVLNERAFLHTVEPRQFLDSPEFESSSGEETFRVTICAAVPSTYIVWQRAELEYLFVKEPYLAQALSAVIARDIADKLYSMNSKLRVERPTASEIEEEDSGTTGLDIRLPGIAGGISRMNNREHANLRNNNFVC